MIQLEYSGTAPGAVSTESTLFDSTAYARARSSKGIVSTVPGCRYRLSLKHTQKGVLKLYASSDLGATWVQFFERYLPAPADTKRAHEFAIPVGMHRDVKATWTNGGSAQAVWYVGHALMSAEECDNVQDIQAVVPAPSANLNNYTEAVSTTHFVRPVKTAWLGRRLRFSARTANIWVLFGTDDTVEADRAAVVSSASSSGWTGSVKITEAIPAGGYRDFYVDPSHTHFSAEGDAAGVLTAVLSDYEETDLPV